MGRKPEEDALCVQMALDRQRMGLTFAVLRDRYADHYTGTREYPTRGWAKKKVYKGLQLLEDRGDSARYEAVVFKARPASPKASADAPGETPVSHETATCATPDCPNRRRVPARRVLMRGAVFDLETTDFGTEGYSGYLICCCVLPLDRDEVETHIIRYDEHGDDRRLVREVAGVLNGYEILIGHNIQAFDLNFLASRCMFHGLPLVSTALIFDTYQISKTLALKTRKSLGNLLDYFGLEGEKTSIYRTSWNNIRSPYLGEFNEAARDIAYHCEQDVIGNRNLFDTLYPYAMSLRTNPFKVSKLVIAGGTMQAAA